MKLPNKVFVDTSFFIALMNSRDTYHSQAVKLQEQLSKQPMQKITSDYILLELCDGLAKLNYRQFAIQLIGINSIINRVMFLAIGMHQINHANT